MVLAPHKEQEPTQSHGTETLWEGEEWGLLLSAAMNWQIGSSHLGKPYPLVSKPDKGLVRSKWGLPLVLTDVKSTSHFWENWGNTIFACSMRSNYASPVLPLTKPSSMFS